MPTGIQRRTLYEVSCTVLCLLTWCIQLEVKCQLRNGEDEASWTCPYSPGMQEVMVCLTNLKEEQINPSSILGGLSCTPLAVVLFSSEILPSFLCCCLASPVLEGKGEFLGKQREVVWMRHRVFKLPNFNKTHSWFQVLGLTHPKEAACAVR